MVRALIQDLKGTGVRINILSPGAVDTPSLRRALGKAAGPEAVDRIVDHQANGLLLEFIRESPTGPSVSRVCHCGHRIRLSDDVHESRI